MKLTFAQINGFVQKPDPAVRVILVYGADAGLVRERIDKFGKMVVTDLNDPFRCTTLTPASIADDPARLRDEMAAQALGGGRRLVRVAHATEALASVLSSLLEDMPDTDTLLLIDAGELDKKSKLRNLCEGPAKNAVGIPCYVEEGADRLRAITDILKTEKIDAPREVIAFLADVLPPDRLATRRELEKLALYVRGQPTVTLEDVAAVVQDAGAAEMDDLVFSVGTGESRKAAQLLDRMVNEQTSTVAIMRAAQRHFLRLQMARYHMDKGLSPAEAVKKLQPAVFWKREASMVAQVRRWSPERLSRALSRLYETEAALKRTGVPDTALCAQTLLGLAG